MWSPSDICARVLAKTQNYTSPMKISAKKTHYSRAGSRNGLTSDVNFLLSQTIFQVSLKTVVNRNTMIDALIYYNHNDNDLFPSK